MKKNCPFNELSHLNELKPGDVLLFLPWPSYIPFVNRVFMFFQSLFYAKEGFYTATHAAIYAGKLVSGEHQIVHVAEEGFKFRRDTLELLEKQEKEKRPFCVFRPKNQDLANYMLEQIKENDLREPLKWSLLSAVSTLFKSGKPSVLAKSHVKPFSRKTHCSKFVAQCLRNAAIHSSEPILPIRSTITPAGLFKALYESQQFEKSSYLAGIDVYSALCELLEKEILRIGLRRDKRSREKHVLAKTCFSSVKEKFSQESSNSSLSKAYVLFEKMKPILAINTGRQLRQAKSFSAMMDFTRRFGLFSNRTQESVETNSLALSFSVFK